MKVLCAAAALIVLCSPVQAGQRGAKPAPAKPAAPAAPQFFTTPLVLDQMRNKQAVVETDAGTIVIDTSDLGIDAVVERILAAIVR